MDKYYTIKKYDGVEYTDITLQLKEYDTPATSLELTTSSYLYVGYSKPFNSFFLELDTKSAAGALLSAEYYDGSTWQALALSDESQGFSKSGFIYFEKPENFSSVDVDGSSKYFIRLTPSLDTGAVTAKLLDVMFSSDLDLTKIRENIVSKFALQGTWAAKHIAARDHIIQEIRNRGSIKEVKKDAGLITEEILYKDITKHDFLEPMQLRVAASYFALYLIFWFELSDEEGDKWQLKAGEMYRLYEKAVEPFFIALDLDDDGVQGEDDKAANTSSVRTIITGTI